MGLLGTDPAFQRRGRATTLLRHVLDMADAEGRRVFVEARLAALPLYERLGWRVIDKLTFPMEDEEVKERRVKDEERRV